MTIYIFNHRQELVESVSFDDMRSAYKFFQSNQRKAKRDSYVYHVELVKGDAIVAMFTRTAQMH